MSAITHTSTYHLSNTQAKAQDKYKRTCMRFPRYVQCVCDALFDTNLHLLCNDQTNLQLHLYQVNCHRDVSTSRLFASTPMLCRLASALQELTRRTAENVNTNTNFKK